MDIKLIIAFFIIATFGNCFIVGQANKIQLGDFEISLPEGCLTKIPKGSSTKNAATFIFETEIKGYQNLILDIKYGKNLKFNLDETIERYVFPEMFLDIAKVSMVELIAKNIDFDVGVNTSLDFISKKLNKYYLVLRNEYHYKGQSLRVEMKLLLDNIIDKEIYYQDYNVLRKMVVVEI